MKLEILDLSTVEAGDVYACWSDSGVRIVVDVVSDTRFAFYLALPSGAVSYHDDGYRRAAVCDAVVVRSCFDPDLLPVK